jgi:hypothetical protein
MVGRLSLALGLALDKAGKINLLPKKTKPIAAKFDLSRIFNQLNIKMPEGAKLDVKLPANSLVIAVSIFVIAAISYNLILIKERNTFRGQLATKQLLLQDIKTLAEKRQMADQISKEETQVRETLSQITGILPSGITLIDLSYDNTQRRVLITGQAGSASQVGKMIKNFEDSPNFKKTVLIEARKTVVDGNPRVLFKISFILT